MLVLIVTALPGILYAQYCGWGPSHVAVYHWKAKYGPVARYAASVADTSQSTGYIIILGKDSSGVYTVEGGSEDDARGGDYAYLAYSTYSGTRSIYPIYDGNMLERYLETKEYDQKRKEIMLARLWQYATEKKYVYGNFRPLYYSVYRNENEPTVLYIRDGKKNSMLSWSLASASSMCWCWFMWEFSVEKTH